MIIRALTLVGALAGGASLSQFPEYSQQYQQRLAGAVDEMRAVVDRFDDSLAAVGLTRDEAFAQTGGSELERRLVADGKANVERLSFLETALARVRNAPVLQQLLSTPAVADRQIAAAAWSDFQPALPLSVVGLACAGLGLIGGWVLCAVLFGLGAMLFGAVFRRRAAA